MFLHINDVKYIKDHQIEVSFNNGRKGIADLCSALTGKIFEPLQDPSLACRVMARMARPSNSFIMIPCRSTHQSVRIRPDFRILPLPLRMTATSLEQIARGDLPEVITEEYQGDFNQIKDHLNAQIKAMQTITELAQEMAQGNLAVTVTERSEHDTLMQALNTMIHRLSEVVIHVQSAANYVASSSQETSSSAEQMSQGAARQAATAEEVSSTMEQMAANIRQNAQNALQTEKIATKSAEDARKSGEAVEQTVQAMREIAQKTQIIEEIANQTRMLSLNATIEAAKAQDHGKGFAVVASEVRSLAERSRTSAEEIKQLAHSSLTIAEKAGNMLHQLVPNIEETAMLVQEISAASNEQRLGAEQVNQAVQQLDQVIQQNASIAEQTAATAEELSQQAEQLQTTSGFFHVTETTEHPKEHLYPLLEHLQTFSAPERQKLVELLAAMTSTPEKSNRKQHALPQMRTVDSGNGREQQMDKSAEKSSQRDLADDQDELDENFERY